MARILDENFREQGYSESWLEEIQAGCTVDENFSVSSFTAGTTAPDTLYGYCAKFQSDGNATNIVRITHNIEPSLPILYFRYVFIVISANLSDSASAGLYTLLDSNDNTITSCRLKYTIATGLYTFFASVISASTPDVAYLIRTVSINTENIVEIFWDVTNSDAAIKLNATSVATYAISSSRTIYKVRIGTHEGTAAITYYVDNIRINDNTGDTNNSWPGTSYDEPLREVNYLSTQRFIGMSL